MNSFEEDYLGLQIGVVFCLSDGNTMETGGERVYVGKRLDSIEPLVLT